MAITVKVGTAVEGTNGTTTAIPYPTTAAGDVLVILGALKTPTAVTTPTGWTQLSNFAESSGASLSLVAIVQNATATGTETGTYSLTHPTTTGLWQMFALSGVDTSSVLDTTVSIYNPGASSGSSACPSLTVATANALLLYAATLNSTTVTATPPTGFTETADRVSGNTAAEFAYKNSVSTGATGTVGNTWSAGAKNIGLLMAIRPLVASPKQGSASGTFTFAGAATGAATHQGTASGGFALAGAAAGSTAHSGTAAGTFSFAGSAAGTTARQGSASGGVSFAGAATGSTAHSGSASGTVSWAGSATGTATHSGSAAGTITWAGMASGSAPAPGQHAGTATGSFTWAGAATGQSVRQGSAAGAYSFTGTAVGARSAAGSAAGTFTWAGVANGASRVLEVPGVRVTTVAAETRSVTVTADPRTITVAAESRLCVLKG